MIQERQELLHIKQMTGTNSIVIIYNDIENKRYIYLVNEFKPASPSNHIHTNSLKGREISTLLKGVTSFATGSMPSEENALLTKLEQIPIESYEWIDFKWVCIR